MKLLVDTHTHTEICGHAYSSIFENVTVAREKGLEAIVVTEHSGLMPDADYPKAVLYQRHLPREYGGVKIFRGIEANIVDHKGTIDLDERYFHIIDFLIASLHEVTLEIGSKTENTEAMLGALNHPQVDILGHPGNPVYDVDREAVVLEAKRLGKMLEFNGHSYEARPGSEPNCIDMLKLCKKHEVRICCGSDAHFCFNVGAFDHAYDAIQKTNFPEELIVSRTLKTFEAYLLERNARLNLE